MLKKTAAVMAAAFAALVWEAGMARAQMMGGMMESGRGMMAGRMAGMMGPELASGCWADLGDLGLSSETRNSLEDKRFEVRKRAIRTAADLEILRLDLARMLESRTFDLKAAEQKNAEIGQKETELRAAHLGLLHDLGAALSDEQWQKLGRKGKEMMPGGMMPMMGGMAGQGMAPCMTGGMMQGGGMMHSGGMMQGGSGMMMKQGGPGGEGEHSAHHPGSSEEAEKFFEEKK